MPKRIFNDRPERPRKTPEFVGLLKGVFEDDFGTSLVDRQGGAA